MSMPHRRPLGAGQDLPEPPPRDPRSFTAAYRLAATRARAEQQAAAS
ncbi:hypothetical protein AB0451_33400 [Streptomyces sp. NPDC052000]